jgi:hypothetical protein
MHIKILIKEQKNTQLLAQRRKILIEKIVNQKVDHAQGVKNLLEVILSSPKVSRGQVLYTKDLIKAHIDMNLIIIEIVLKRIVKIKIECLLVKIWLKKITLFCKKNLEKRMEAKLKIKTI